MYIEEKEREREKREKAAKIFSSSSFVTNNKYNVTARVIFIFTLASKIANSSRQIRRFSTPK